MLSFGLGLVVVIQLEEELGLVLGIDLGILGVAVLNVAVLNVAVLIGNLYKVLIKPTISVVFNLVPKTCYNRYFRELSSNIYCTKSCLNRHSLLGPLRCRVSRIPIY